MLIIKEQMLNVYVTFPILHGSKKAFAKTSIAVRAILPTTTTTGKIVQAQPSISTLVCPSSTLVNFLIQIFHQQL